MLKLLLFGLLLAPSARAQCLDWAPGYGRNLGMNAPVSALATFDDGGGEALYAGGEFTSAGTADANRIARWNGTSWSTLAGGLNGPVRALAVFDGGSGPELYAGGEFTDAGGGPAAFIARWDGSSWSSVGAGTDAPVRAFGVFDDGSGPALYVGGDFTTAGGASARYIALWDGTTWSALAGGDLDGSVLALAVFDGGGGPALHVGGAFANAGGAAVGRIAKWNGAGWSSLGNGTGVPVRALCVYDGGSGPNLYAGGDFSVISGVSANRIAQWSGTAWSAMGTGVSGGRVDVLLASGAYLVVGGSFTSAGGLGGTPYVAKWRPFSTGWSILGGVNYGVRALANFDDGSGPSLFAGGDFTTAGSELANRIARYGSSWSSLGSAIGGAGVDSSAFALEVFDDGSGPALYAGGSFAVAGGVASGPIARFDGAVWAPLGSGVNDAVYALEVFDDGSGPALFAGGRFTSAGGAPADHVARWDGSLWSPLANGTNGEVDVLETYDDGTGPALFAAGSFSSAGGVPANHIARWDGASWSALGTGTDFPASAMAVFDDGGGPALYVGGNFQTAGGSTVNGVARWNGTSWSALGTGLSPVVRALAAFDDGGGSALYAGGDFTTSGGAPGNFIVRWNGSSWSPLPDGMFGSGGVEVLAVFDDGGGPALHAARFFNFGGGSPLSRLAKWDGSIWSGPVASPNGPIHALREFQAPASPRPSLYAGGLFTTVGGIPSAHIAEWRGCTGPVASFCFGDGVMAPCPCINNGLHGHGCENSTLNGGARLYASGTTSPDTLVLHATGELPTALTIFMQGENTIPATRFGDGIRCAGGHILRLYARNASGGTVAAPGLTDPGIQERSAALGYPIPPGSNRSYQTYYRDPNPGHCTGNTFNSTNALRVAW